MSRFLLADRRSFRAPGLDGLVNDGLEVGLVQGVEHVAQPLSVEVDPVALVREVLEQVRARPEHLKDVLDSEALYLGHGCDEHLIAPYVLSSGSESELEDLPLWSRA